MGLLENYSGIVLNQNHTTTGQYTWRASGGNWVYQTFTLPVDYQRGTNSKELRIPDLSGFQILTYVDPGVAIAATLDYTLQYFVGSSGGWQPLASGTVIGVHSDTFAWFDVIFDQPVIVTTSMTTKLFRLGVQTRTAGIGSALNIPATISNGLYVVNGQSYLATLTPGVPFPITAGGLPAFLLLSGGQVTFSIQHGIETLSYVSPTPLLNTAIGHGQAYQSNAITPLLGANTTSSLNFRILSLTADSGTNFLGNTYRSVVVQARGTSTDTTQGLNITSGSTGGNYWLSQPQPSRFAVQSLYFDQRPVASIPAFGATNLIGNPGFEYDSVGQAPQWWTSFNSGGTVVDQTVQSTWASNGVQSLHMQYTFSNPNQQIGVISNYLNVSPTTGGQLTQVSGSLAYNTISASNAAVFFTFLFYDGTQTLLPSPYGTVSFDPSGIGIGAFSATTAVPANASFLRILVSALSTGAGSIETYVDALQVTQTSSALPYFDGDSPNCEWIGQRGQSPSVQVIDPSPSNNAVVVDGVMVDPITPNMTFNVYYTQDDSYTGPNMVEADWEQKLWSRVPKVFVCNQRQQYVFPEPVQAKYLKIEFTNLQPRSYDPGNFQKALTYKKFPTWVAAYFASQIMTPSFVASTVAVQYNALQFLYEYVLDDLAQSPTIPRAAPVDAISQLTSYFSAQNSINGVDATTLRQIDLVTKPFQTPLGSNVDSSTSLGAYTSGLVNANSSTLPAVSEGGVLPHTDLTAVSSLQRESVVLEQSLPAMYFFITCRHSYKELTATLQKGRAYFAGINEIAWLRHNYTAPSDTRLYVESGADLANIEFTDWVIDTDGHWYTY